MKKAILIAMFLLLFSTPAFASSYNFENEPLDFGRDTSFEPVEVLEVRETTNIKRNKDSAFIPPTFGSRSADTPSTGELLTPNISGVEPMKLSGNANPSVPFASGNYVESYTEVYAPSYTNADEIKQSDGSIGRLKIDKLGLNVKVYEGESLASLKKGVGHFSVTSAWNGNVAMAGHNRGTNAYFGQIHNLKNGDIITYSTTLGTRNYSVYSVEQVHETDVSRLGRTQENIITLITCVRNVPEKRWVVTAREI